MDWGAGLSGAGRGGLSLVNTRRFRRPVQDARGGKNEARDARLLREFRKPDRPLPVDLPRPGFVQVADRIVAECRQMNHRVETGEFLGGNLSSVLAACRAVSEAGDECAGREVSGVET